MDEEQLERVRRHQTYQWLCKRSTQALDLGLMVLAFVIITLCNMVLFMADTLPMWVVKRLTPGVKVLGCGKRHHM